MRPLLSKLVSALLPTGVYKRDADGVPVITVSWNGTTEMTHAGIERALARQFALLQGAERCLTCHRVLNVANEPGSLDCGGDCRQCMVLAGDPDCARALACTSESRVDKPA
jgi:hypothetical protein